MDTPFQRHNTFGRDSEASIRFIIADYLLPWMNGHSFLMGA